MRNKLVFNININPTLSFVEKVGLIAGVGFSGVGLRMPEIEDYLMQGDSFKGLLEAAQAVEIEIIELHVLRDWLYAIGVKKKQAINRMKQMCIFAKNLHIPYICIVGDSYAGNTSMAVNNFKEICDIADDYGLAVAFEFLGWDRINNLKDAWELVYVANKKNGGLLIDSVHFFTGGSKIVELDRIPAEKIFLVHISDLPYMYGNDLKKLTRTQRMLPGEGVLNLTDFISKLVEINYLGPYSLEILNREFLTYDPKCVVKKGYDTLKGLITSATIR